MKNKKLNKAKESKPKVRRKPIPAHKVHKTKKDYKRKKSPSIEEIIDAICYINSI